MQLEDLYYLRFASQRRVEEEEKNWKEKGVFGNWEMLIRKQVSKQDGSNDFRFWKMWIAKHDKGESKSIRMR